VEFEEGKGAGKNQFLCILFMIGTLFSEPRRLAVELCILFLLDAFERGVGC